MGRNSGRIQKIGDVHPERKLAAAAQFVVESKFLKSPPALCTRVKTIFVGPMDARAKSGEFFRARRFRHEIADEAAREFFQALRWLRRSLDRGL